MRAFFRTLIRTTITMILCSALVPLAVIAVILASFIFLPLPASLPAPKPGQGGQITRIYDQNGAEIGQLRKFDLEVPVKPTDIPLVLKQALIAAEDRNFYAHGGVDVRGTMRALYQDVRGGGIRQGGSTITQQYVKDAYVGKERTLLRKVREAIVASQLDRQIEKDEILFRYLSRVYLGNGAYGVGAASQLYFRKPVNNISLSEAATLVGVIPAPSFYAPINPPPEGQIHPAENKRRIVLRAMLGEGYIDQAQFDDAMSQELRILGPNQGPPEGVPHTAVYPRPDAQYDRFPYFMDYVRKYLEARYGEDKVFEGGLRVQTTLDPKVQEAAEAAAAKARAGVRPARFQAPHPQAANPEALTPFEVALASIEPPTGFVKAIVGGADFNAPGGQVNLGLGGCYNPKNDSRFEEKLPPIEVEAACWPLDAESQYVKSGGTGRQPGSSFKPFVLAAAFEKGIQPEKVYPAPAQYRIPDCKPTPNFDCTIGNYEGGGGGSANLRVSTQKSYNTVYAQLVRDVGCKETGEMAKKLGLTSAWYSPQIHTCSGSYALGTLDVGPLEMASAYATFANRGVYQEPTPVVRIEEPDGNGGFKVLEDNRRRDGERVIDEVVADNVTDVLRTVIEGGTGTKANIGRPAAGKTGTSQANRNAWFVGYTPTLSTAVWVGYRDQPIPMRGIKGCGQMTGGCLPAPTWKDFMSVALKDVPSTDFSEPAPIKVITDKLNKEARTGIDPGPQRKASGTSPGGPYQVGPAAPKASPPETTSTTVDDGSNRPPSDTEPGPRPTTTTTTTRPGGLLNP
ncbi:MAG TPA: transglycosylase domain-containing protein [Acidimicrobiales bacterium]|jgi:penicillin-binding protein 1A|nr:transglycosylase domain-containing protein [Acidimicrobiales bacterium]